MNSAQPWIRRVKLLIGAFFNLESTGDAESLRIRFTVHKHGMGTSTPTTIEIFNLEPKSRSTLTKDLLVILQAGWTTDLDLPIIFSGLLQAAYSRREGPDIITTLLCLDVGTALSRTYVPPPPVKGGTYETGIEAAPGELLSDVVRNLASEFPITAVRSVKVELDDNLVIGSGGYSFYGLIMDSLDELARTYGFGWTVIDGNFIATMDGKPLKGAVTKVDSANGFLIRVEPVFSNIFQDQSGVIIQTVLNPNILPETVVELTSVVNPELSGDYLVTTVVHSGDTHSSQWMTTSETCIVGNTGL